MNIYNYKKYVRPGTLIKVDPAGHDFGSHKQFYEDYYPVIKVSSNEIIIIQIPDKVRAEGFGWPLLDDNNNSMEGCWYVNRKHILSVKGYFSK